MCLKIYKNSFHADKYPTLWLYGVIIPPKYVCKYIKKVFMPISILLFGYIELDDPKKYVCKYIKIVFMLIRILLFGYMEL
jgi:hypothetical protein